MSDDGLVAEPMSALAIWGIANSVRRLFVPPDLFYFPIVPVVEVALAQLSPDYRFCVVEDYEMPSAYAEAMPDVPALRVRNTVYNGAYQGNCRDRFTLAHELAHLFLHSGSRLQRMDRNAARPAYRNPEWQANTFAAELLMPAELYKKIADPEKARDTFGISGQAIKNHLAALARNEML